LARVGDGGDFPAFRGFEEGEGIDAAVGEFSVQVEIVFGPEGGDGAVLEEGGIPDALEPGVFARAESVEKFFVREGGGRAVGVDGVEHGVGKEERAGGGGVMGRHGVEEALDDNGGALCGGVGGGRGCGAQAEREEEGEESLHRASLARHRRQERTCHFLPMKN
jgi:hypothetical protein